MSYRASMANTKRQMGVHTGRILRGAKPAALARAGFRQSNLAEAAKLAYAALRASRRRFAANVRPIIEEIMRSGVTSHNAIAQKLNERNVRTARGGTWTHVQVGAILHPFEVAA